MKREGVEGQEEEEEEEEEEEVRRERKTHKVTPNANDTPYNNYHGCVIIIINDNVCYRLPLLSLLSFSLPAFCLA